MGRRVLQVSEETHKMNMLFTVVLALWLLLLQLPATLSSDTTWMITSTPRREKLEQPLLDLTHSPALMVLNISRITSLTIKVTVLLVMPKLKPLLALLQHPPQHLLQHPLLPLPEPLPQHPPVHQLLPKPPLLLLPSKLCLGLTLSPFNSYKLPTSLLNTRTSSTIPLETLVSATSQLLVKTKLSDPMVPVTLCRKSHKTLAKSTQVLISFE